MKRIILTIAAMLLLCADAFAQSSTPLKGDVNGDGKVDVADIAAIIQIMKNGGAEVAVTGITLDKSSLTLSANGTGTIKATIAPSNATSQGIIWTSDDPSIATVTALTVSGENATVTWKKSGTVTITAKAVGDNSKKATCTVKCLAEGVVVYYWYVGAENPTSIGTVQTNAGLEGWREIGTSLNGWSFEVDNTNKIKFNDYPATHQYYIVIPNTLHLYFADNTLAENVTFTERTCSIANYKAWQLSDGESATAKGFIIK